MTYHYLVLERMEIGVGADGACVCALQHALSDHDVARVCVRSGRARGPADTRLAGRASGQRRGYFFMRGRVCGSGARPCRRESCACGLVDQLVAAAWPSQDCLLILHRSSPPA